MNRLKWQDDGVSLEKDVYAPLTFKTVISNKSGVNEAYSISNIPSWLTCNAPTGVITPQQNKEITFVVNEAIGIGRYESTLSLAGSNNVSEAYVVSLKVKGEKPNWSVDPGKFETSMTITGQLKIENILFASLKQQGSISAPIIIDALNVINQQLSLKKGWNWVSVSVENQENA